MLRSSVQTIQRYRTATDHLVRFLETRPVRYASHFRAAHAEEFVRHLRSLRVSPNGHAHTPKRRLMDKGLRYVLECCRALFNYVAKRRHLSPYSENPFRTLEIDRIPVEQVRPIELFTKEQEQVLLEACNAWQFPLFLTLMLTGLRPGEQTYLLLPDDLDLAAGILLMGHVAAGERTAGHGLAMTAVYTHTRPETQRQQLEAALSNRPALAVARSWLLRHSPGPVATVPA